jgi:hypothetical protein
MTSLAACLLAGREVIRRWWTVAGANRHKGKATKKREVIYHMDDSQNQAMKDLLAFIGIICLIVGVVFWVIRHAVSQAIRDNKKTAPPVVGRESPDGPGHYKIIGVDKESKLDTTWYVNAESRDNAKVKAELEGIVVTSVIRESPKR